MSEIKKADDLLSETSDQIRMTINRILEEEKKYRHLENLTSDTKREIYNGIKKIIKEDVS